jgi:hypothetical protein
MTRFLYYGDIFCPKREKFVPEFSKLYGVYLLYVQKTSLNKWSKDRQRQSTIYIQTKIAKSLSQKNESKNENNFTQMSNHLKYEDPTLSKQQAASATQLLQNGENSKSKHLYSIKYIIPYKKKYTSQNVKGRRAKQISVM